MAATHPSNAPGLALPARHRPRRLDPEALNDLVVHDNDLANALTALAGAVVALRRRFARPARTWTLIAAFTGGQLLGPAPAT